MKSKFFSNNYFWSFLEQFGGLGITFINSALLTRYLDPSDFGVIASVTIIFGIGEAIITFGFSSVLIGMQKISKNEYSTVFTFSFSLSIILYFIIFFSAPSISSFFKVEPLVDVLKLLGVTLILEAITVVFRIQNLRNLKFKFIAFSSIFINLISSFVSLYLAYLGFGLWSIVWYRVTNKALFLFLFIFQKGAIFPKFLINRKFLYRNLPFAFSVFFSGILEVVFRNIYNVIIGKYYSMKELGFYNRAQELSNIPTQGLSTVFTRVSFPVLSIHANDRSKAKSVFRNIVIIMTTTFSFMLIILISFTHEIVGFVYGSGWVEVGNYLPFFCLSAFFYPLNDMNVLILHVYAKGKELIYLELIKKILLIPVIFVSLNFGIKALLISLALHAFMAFFINSFFASRLIGYGAREQLRDISFPVVSGFACFIVIYLLKFLWGLKYYVSFILISFMILMVIRLLFKSSFKSHLENIINNFKFL